MKKLESQKTESKKEYFIPMEVTTESIKALGIKEEDITWKKIGGRLVRVSHFAGKVLKRYGNSDRAREAFLEKAGKCHPPRGTCKFHRKKAVKNLCG